MTLQDFLSRLDGVRGHGDKFMARCPAHDDHDPSLSITQGEDGRILLHCFAGCSTKSILDSLGLSLRDLFPENDDLSYLIGRGQSAEEISRLADAGVPVAEQAEAARRLEAREQDCKADAMGIFRPISEFQEIEAKWLVPEWIPAGQITLLASDGGVGKTSIVCNIAAAISSGGRCILDSSGARRDPQRVLFFTTEDSISQKLKKKLRLLHAQQSNIIAPDPALDDGGCLRGLKFGEPLLEEVIKQYRPALCIMDPVQGYVPANVNMCSRNAMRDCMSTLTGLGEQTGCAFLVVCHSNKRRGASGRDRISDSSDLWDIARSVIMAGYDPSEQGLRYLANEKNNYASLQETVLFRMTENGLPEHAGFSEKHDRDFIQESYSTPACATEPFNSALLDALEAASNPFEPVKFSYSSFEKIYGSSIWGGKQPKRALEAVRAEFEAGGYILEVKTIKLDGEPKKGFIIQKAG